MIFFRHSSLRLALSFYSNDTVNHADRVGCGSTASTNDRSTGFDPFLDALDVDGVMLNTVVHLDTRFVILRWDPEADVAVSSDPLLFWHDASEMLHLFENCLAVHAVDSDECCILELVDDVDKWSSTA